MRGKINSVFWGLLLVAVGIGFLGDAVGLWGAFSFGALFGETWWAFLVLAIGISTLIGTGVHTGGLVITGVGIVLTVNQLLDFFRAGFGLGWEILLPVVLILIGISIIFGLHGHKTKNAGTAEIETERKKKYEAVFSGKVIRLDGPITEDFSVESTFSGVELHMENTEIAQDITVHIRASFGGVTVFVPGSANVRLNGSAVFGGNNSNHLENRFPDAPCVTFECNSSFGGIELKE